MREILFRAKRQDNGEWIEGYLSYGNIIKTVRKCYDWRGDYVCDSLEEYKVDKETVGQFTGLTDKNVEKIFEGDIVRVKITQTEDKETYGNCKFKIGVIVYYEDFALFTCKNNFMNFINWAFNEYEVIGNIHDNPELLESE